MGESARDRHLRPGGPKRILCLDGGGLRGSLTLGILKELETFLRRRHGNDPRFRLAHYFDLIAGTSTGAIIAATLARGMTVEDVYTYYQGMGAEVFRTTLVGRLTAGLVRPRYDREVLERYLQQAVGPETKLGDEDLVTGLMIVAKRLDTHSVWVFVNNPKAKYFESIETPKGPSFPNKDYPLWKLLRASAAAPTYFAPERVVVGDIDGDFIDGGMSPFNDPSLQALMYVTLEGHHVGWTTGADNLLLVSVGTGTFDPPKAKEPRGPLGWLRRRMSRLVEPGGTVRTAFFSLLHDNQSFTKTLMQWLSSSPTASQIDSEIGDLGSDLLAGHEVLSYVRLDAKLDEKGLEGAVEELSDLVRGREIDFNSITRMDEAANVDLLWRIGRVTGASEIGDDLFPGTFDLEEVPGRVFRVGVVGHRDNVLRADAVEAVKARVREVLERIARTVEAGRPEADGFAGARSPLCIVSALAEGADRIAAFAALDAGYALECPLPFDRQEYEQDFTRRRSRRQFRDLLGRADVVRELPGSRDEADEAYAAVGAEIVALSDVLLAVWDGEEARGRGGTAEVVRAAAKSKPVLWVHAHDAREPTLLRLDEEGEPAPRDLAGLEAEIERILAE